MGSTSVAAADICRRDAIFHFTRAKEAGEEFAGGNPGDLLLLADLYRRTGQFDQVVALCQRGLAEHPEHQALFAFIRHLPSDPDNDCHRIEEAHAPST